MDRPKTQLVDWNVVGVRIAGPLPQDLPCQGRYAVSLGHTVEWRSVGYQWELVGVLDLEVRRRPWGAPYARMDVRFVSVDPEARRSGDFVDFLGQARVRLVASGHNLDLFAAYEHRNDVPVLSAGSRDRALLGLRIGFAPGAGAGTNLPVGWPGP